MSGSYFYRKIILVSLFVAFCVGASVPKNADALGPTPEQGAAIGAETTPQKTSIISTGSSDLANSELGGAVRSEPAQPSSEQNEEIYCVRGSWDTVLESSIPGCIALGLQTVLGWVAWVLWLSAVLFNFAIPYTLNMADFIRDIPIVALGWATFRDVTNLFFIFIILYIAISEILGRGDYGIKKLLGKVIIGAMFINFSLFFTQALVDVSNIFTLQFYNKITQTDSAKAAVSGGVTGSKYDGGISAAFVKALGLEEMWNVGRSATTQSNSDSGKKLGLNSKNLIVASLGGIILILITAFIFFAAIIMFLARAVTLIFLMILSPIAFLGHVLPELGKHTGKWWKHLIDNLLFAPAYMALMYLVISIIADKSKFDGVGGGGSFIGIFAGDTNMIGSAMTFLVLIMMMIGCLFIAKEFSVTGSGWAFKTGTGWAKGLGMTLSGAGLVTGGGSIIARNVIGGGASRLAQSETMRNYAPGKVLRGLNSLADKKFGRISYTDRKKEKTDLDIKAAELRSEVGPRRKGETAAEFDARKAEGRVLAARKLGLAYDGKNFVDAGDKRKVGQVFGRGRLARAQASWIKKQGKSAKDNLDEQIESIREQLKNYDEGSIASAQTTYDTLKGTGAGSVSEAHAQVESASGTGRLRDIMRANTIYTARMSELNRAQGIVSKASELNQRLAAALAKKAELDSK